MSDTATAPCPAITALEAAHGLKRLSYDARSATAIYKKVPVLRLTGMQYSGSFFDFVDDEGRIDALIAAFAAVHMTERANGIFVYTRTPIGSGFNVELRATEAENLETLLTLAKVKPAIRAEIAAIDARLPLTPLSLSASSLVAFATGSRDEAAAVADRIATAFPRLADHFGACMPGPVDVAKLTREDIARTGTLFLRW